LITALLRPISGIIFAMSPLYSVVAAEILRQVTVSHPTGCRSTRTFYHLNCTEAHTEAAELVIGVAIYGLLLRPRTLGNSSPAFVFLRKSRAIVFNFARPARILLFVKLKGRGQMKLNKS